MDSTVATDAQGGAGRARRIGAGRADWGGAYLVRVGAADAACAFATDIFPLIGRVGLRGHPLSLPFALLTAAMPLVWCAAVALAGGYSTRLIGAGSGEFRRVLQAGIVLIALTAVASYASRTAYGREYVLLTLPGTIGLDLGARYLLRKRLHRQRSRGTCMQRAIAVGHAQSVAGLIAELRRDTSHGLCVVAACVAGAAAAGEIAGIPVYGDLDAVPAAVAGYAAATVAVAACPELSGHQLRLLAWELEKTGTQLCLAPGLLDITGPRATIRQAGGVPLVHVSEPSLTGLRYVLKGAADRALAALALLLLAPALAATALVIKLSDPGPVLFRQVRVGRHGDHFPVFKFRTMVVGAEGMKSELLAVNEMNGVLFKIRSDPRLTRCGGSLRRWSVDELPQLLNVLRGEMSLVGPRPWAPRPYREASAEDDAVWRRLAVKPGITGLWQVSGRADLPWQESVRLDVHYVENWSLGLDLRILWRTGKAVVRGSGAY